MNEKLLIQLSEILLVAIVIIGILVIFAATLYDLRAITQKKSLISTLKRLSTNRQPSITILVYARNNAETITKCLRSITASRYANYQIVVANNASDDVTQLSLMKFKRQNQKVPLEIYSQRQFSSRLTCLRVAQSKVQSSALTLIINASDVIPPMLLKESAARFMANDSLDTLRLRRVSVFDRNLVTIPLQFVRLSQNIFNKALSTYGALKGNYTKSAVMIRSAIFSQNYVPRKITSAYASTLIISSLKRTDLAPNERQSGSYVVLSTIKTVACIAGIIMISYFLYTAAILQSSIFLTLSWVIVSLWLVTVIWSDEMLSRRLRLDLSLTIPFMYFVLYVYLIYSLGLIVWRSISAVRPSPLTIHSLHNAIQHELYSTRY